MKTIITLTLLACLAASKTFAADQANAQTPVASAPVEITAATNASPAESTGSETNSADGIRMNFRDVPLDMVLNYLSEAAGFVIVLDATPRGKVNVWSNSVLSKDEAVELLNSVLNKNGLAAIRHGRTLTIVNKDEAKTRDIPVVLESNPDKIPKTDEMVTQIIPVRFVEVAQLVKDLQPLVGTATTMTANEAGNSIMMTDTRANIHRVAEILHAIDQGAEDVTEVRVFHLEFADPTEMATLLGSVFPDDSKSSGNQSPVQFGGRTGGFGRIFGGGGSPFGGGSTGSGSNTDPNSRIKKRAKVIAVPDARTSSIIVSATSTLIEQIADMVKQLDSNPAKHQKVYVYQVNPGDVQQVQQVLEDMFESSTSTSRNSGRNSTLQNNVLQNRATQSQTGSGSTSTFGSGSSSRPRTSTGGGGF